LDAFKLPYQNVFDFLLSSTTTFAISIQTPWTTSWLAMTISHMAKQAVYPNLLHLSIMLLWWLNSLERALKRAELPHQLKHLGKMNGMRAPSSACYSGRLLMHDT